MSSETKYSLTLKELLENDHYKVPVYQRNYDWGKAQIEQLINDIQDYAKNEEKHTYYLGSLIVHQRDNYFEILDGQQRFTTLSLLAIYLKSRLPKIFSWYEKPNLSFESRPKSDAAIERLLHRFALSGDGKEIDLSECSASIISGFEIINTILSVDNKNDNISLQRFADYLLKHVEILKIQVPKNTDVTHYFEVMNNRGEQLEKHEVVKSNLLAAVQDDMQTMAIIQKVWLACSDMNRYVQAGFNVQERKAVFGNSAEGFKATRFADLTTVLALKNDPDALERPSFNSKLSFDEALEKGKAIKLSAGSDADKDEGRLERFSSVIDFPNFLMHVLRVYLLQESSSKRFALDDKELITAFKDCFGVQGEGHADRVKKFVFTLLKTRYLFDRFVVKRENTNKEGSWSLKRYKLYSSGSSDYVDSFNTESNAEENEDKHERGDTVSCLMLLSAFHVSYPTNSRKNWLSAVLCRLYKQEPANAKDYLVFLEGLAKAFMIHRYLVEEPHDYPSFMYGDDEQLTALPGAFTSQRYDLLSLLSYRKATVFVFNYLDYLLWKKEKGFDKDTLDKFRFSFKSSVEHFSPQTPKANASLKYDYLHSFGNLCLMADADNSSLGNSSPREKSNILNGKRESMAPLSLKLELMMQQAILKEKDWGSIAIETHGEKMLDVINKELGLTYG